MRREVMNFAEGIVEFQPKYRASRDELCLLIEWIGTVSNNLKTTLCLSYSFPSYGPRSSSTENGRPCHEIFICTLVKLTSINTC